MTQDTTITDELAATYAPSGLTYAAVDQNDLWLLRFADQDCGDQWFGGECWADGEARAEAIDAWNRYAPAWSVRLMRTVTLDEVRGQRALLTEQGEVARPSFRAWLAWSIEQARYNRDALDPKAAETMTNILERYDLSHPVSTNMQVAEAVDDLEMALDLICEAKGADGPNGGFFTNHLDSAEHWIRKVQSMLSTITASSTTEGDRE